MTMKRRTFVLSAGAASGLTSLNALATVADAAQAVHDVVDQKGQGVCQRAPCQVGAHRMLDEDV